MPRFVSDALHWFHSERWLPFSVFYNLHIQLPKSESLPLSSNVHTDLLNSFLWRRWDMCAPLLFLPHILQPFQDSCINTSCLPTAILILFPHSDLSTTFFFSFTIFYHTQTLLFCQSLLAHLWCKVLKHSTSIDASSLCLQTQFRQQRTSPMRPFSRTSRKHLVLILVM